MEGPCQWDKVGVVERVLSTSHVRAAAEAIPTCNRIRPWVAEVDSLGVKRNTVQAHNDIQGRIQRFIKVNLVYDGIVQSPVLERYLRNGINDAGLNLDHGGPTVPPMDCLHTSDCSEDEKQPCEKENLKEVNSSH
jgi:hypothetical protein